METDSFFYQLLKHIPQTIFELLDLPTEQAREYRFDSVELKKSLRIDGVFLPNQAALPVLFVEVQFQPSASFYANLFAKVFWFLEENDPAQDWLAVAVFPTRNVEPTRMAPYEDLLGSDRVHRIYLDELRTSRESSCGLGLLQLVSVPIDEAKDFVCRLLEKTRREIADSTERGKVIELTEELLIRRFSGMSREEVRAMFQLADLRNTKVWKEAHEEGMEVGLEKGMEKGIEKGLQKGQLMARKDFVKKCKEKGMSAKAIAELVGIPARAVQRLMKDA